MKKRVLITGYTKNFGGIERTISNFYSSMMGDYVFDFLCSNNNKPIKLDSKFTSNGSEIYYCNTSIRTMMKEAKIFFKNKKNYYDAIIVNFGDLTDAFLLKFAKKAEIKYRIAYAHMGIYSSKNVLKKMINRFCKKLIHTYATLLFSYSESATKLTFLKKDQPNAIIKQPILVEPFIFNERERNRLRKLYQIKEEDIVLGCVGSISPNKNQVSLVETLKLLKEKISSNIILFVIGDVVDKEYGEMFNKSIKNCRELRVVHMGNQASIGAFYSMFDIYISSSKKESFGLTILESYISGLPIIVNKHSIPYDLLQKTEATEVDIFDEDEMLNAIHKCINNGVSNKRNLHSNKSIEQYKDSILLNFEQK